MLILLNYVYGVQFLSGALEPVISGEIMQVNKYFNSSCFYVERLCLLDSSQQASSSLRN